MHAPKYASLPEISRSIIGRNIVRFMYEKKAVTAEPYLLGIHRRTGAYLLLAYRTGDSPGWVWYRFSLIRDYEAMDETCPPLRADFVQDYRRLGGIVTTPLKSPAHQALARADRGLPYVR